MPRNTVQGCIQVAKQSNMKHDAQMMIQIEDKYITVAVTLLEPNLVLDLETEF